MKILAVDSSAASASAALCEDAALLGEFYINIRQTHSETLMPEIHDLLLRCGTDIDEIGLFAVSCGPGSFTGVRIGVAAIKGLAVSRNIPCAAVSTLAAIAQNIPFFDGLIYPVMDARREQVYNAVFESVHGEQRRLVPDRAVPIADIGKEIASSGKRAVFVGDGAELCYNKLKSACNCELMPKQLMYQRADGVAMLGLKQFDDGKTVSPEDLQPFYLRLPQAERELKLRRQAKQKQE